jgi:hypothetical protein
MYRVAFHMTTSPRVAQRDEKQNRVHIDIELFVTIPNREYHADYQIQAEPLDSVDQIVSHVAGASGSTREPWPQEIATTSKANCP